jgi:hypothetical protein
MVDRTLIDKRLVNLNPCRRHTTIHLSKNLKRLLESRLQAFLLGDVGLDVQRLAAESRRPGVEFLLFDDFGLDVPDGDVATHFADCARDGEADTLGAARDDVGAVCEFEGGADGGDHFGWRRGTRGLCLMCCEQAMCRPRVVSCESDTSTGLGDMLSYPATARS